MVVFADTNVFLDALLERPDAGSHCKQILQLAGKRLIKLYSSPACLMTVIYFLQKEMHKADVAELMKELVKIITLTSPSEQTFVTAMDSNFADLEDAVRYQTALSIKSIHYFITSNAKDFKTASSSFPVVSPLQFLRKEFAGL